MLFRCATANSSSSSFAFSSSSSRGGRRHHRRGGGGQFYERRVKVQPLGDARGGGGKRKSTNQSLGGAEERDESVKLLREEEEEEEERSTGKGGHEERKKAKEFALNGERYGEEGEEEKPFVIIKSTRDPTKRKEDAYDKLFANGAFDKKKLLRFFRRRPVRVAGRMTRIVTVFRKLSRQWKSQDDWPMEKRTRAKLLREALSKLGPVFVKGGQTLSQRPDLIGEEAADALKSLQQENEPFEDAIAFQTVVEDLGHLGPLAENHPYQGYDPTLKPLFKSFGKTPIAAASLGQVYKAETWEGDQVAVKVQRPDVRKQVALDWTCWSLSLSALRRLWKSTNDLSVIADEVGSGVWQELDYISEAKHADEFNRRHNWLGFVRAPKWFPKYTGPPGKARVLTTEWIEGAHIADLPQEKKLIMAQMAVEACVAQLVYTGFVHADPHEGNMMLDTSDDSLVFLDFGLMAEVDGKIMEGFAKGIQSMISGDWRQLALVFQEVGFTPEVFEKRNPDKSLRKKVPYVECTLDEIALAIKDQLESEAGGRSRFGALATGLARLSTTYHFLTPPYIILLIRTFLTLEGIAAKADPNFNIYEAALPYAIRRAMAPATPDGFEAMRKAWLTDENALNMDRLKEFLGSDDENEESEAAGSEGDALMRPTEESERLMARRRGEVLSGILGATEGAALRRISHDVDTGSLAAYLYSPEASGIRKQAVKMLSDILVKPTKGGTIFIDNKEQNKDSLDLPEWPESEEARKIRERQEIAARRAISVLLGTHLNRLWKYPIVAARLALTVAVITLKAFVLATQEICVDLCAAVVSKAFGFATFPFRVVRNVFTGGKKGGGKETRTAA
jgi:predicted unusual protein kinase regulating ubiquinone biosynthesis (AarF/ABC1/UbiB family)